MLWATSKKLRVNRAATVWLIKRFIDRDADFVFADDEQVHELERTRGAIGFHAANARYPKRDDRGRCSFEALVEEYCGDDVALRWMAKIIHDADQPGAPSPEPEAAGIRLVSVSFPLVAATDEEIIERSAFFYDVLYAALEKRRAAPENG